MKTKILRTLASFSALTISLLSAPGVFAANPYGIVYEGGEPLGENNVQIAPEMINGLTQLLQTQNGFTVSDSELWKTGYYKSSDKCYRATYFRIWGDNVKTADNLSISYTNDLYKLDVYFDASVIENITGLSEDGKSIALQPTPGGFLTVGNKIYTDANCQNAVSDIVSFGVEPYDQRVFVETTLKLYKNIDNSVVDSDQLYLALNDIDAVQSFKILNLDNLLSFDTMYAKSAEDLQPVNTSAKNIYVAQGNYIYSEPNFNTTQSNIYVKIKEQARRDGMKLVFGFGDGGTGSKIVYFAKQYTINYASDKLGEITGDLEETLLSGNTPSGTTIKVADGYELKYWTADKDVKLSDGKTIAAGKPILASQLKQVVVNSDIAFTAIHGLPEPEKEESPIAVPNTGSFTSETNAALVSISVFGVLLGALMIGILPRLHHKKVNFKQ